MLTAQLLQLQYTLCSSPCFQRQTGILQLIEYPHIGSISNVRKRCVHLSVLPATATQRLPRCFRTPRPLITEIFVQTSHALSNPSSCASVSVPCQACSTQPMGCSAAKALNHVSCRANASNKQDSRSHINTTLTLSACSRGGTDIDSLRQRRPGTEHKPISLRKDSIL